MWAQGFRGSVHGGLTRGPRAQCGRIRRVRQRKATQDRQQEAETKHEPQRRAQEAHLSGRTPPACGLHPAGPVSG